MVQRIRYVKKDGQLASRDSIISSKGAMYLVFINLDTMTYVIRNQTSLRKYEGGEGVNNLHVLKRNIKKHLEHLGCVFSKERRNRSFGVCSQGTTEQKVREERKSKKEQEAASNNGPANNP